MLGIGFFEIVIIALVCFIAVGPKELPIVLRKIAGFYRQFMTLRDELRFQVLSADIESKEDKPTAQKNASDASKVLGEGGHG